MGVRGRPIRSCESHAPAGPECSIERGVMLGQLTRYGELAGEAGDWQLAEVVLRMQEQSGSSRRALSGRVLCERGCVRWC